MRYTEPTGVCTRAPRVAHVVPPAAAALARKRFSLDVGYRDTGSGQKFRRGRRDPSPWVSGCARGYPAALTVSSVHRISLVLAAVALAWATTLAAAAWSGPASASASGAYVALGDSYSSGAGAGGSGACVRSRRAYAYRLGRPVTSFRACAGATTDDVLSRQLGGFPAGTRLVTITIGGNDAGFVDVIESCLHDTPGACSTRVGRAERFVRSSLTARLRRVYDAIRERAPSATVVVAGYPRLFARRPWCGRVGRIDDREQRRLNEAANLLARVTAAEVERHDGFRFADVREAFNGHGICSSSPLINGASSGPSDAFHPTARGYETYARVIRRRL